MSMSFVLPEELQMLQQNLRRYVNTEMIPHERITMHDNELKPEWRERFQAGMKKLGLWMMEVPEEHGGPGLSLLAKSIVWQELGRTIALPSREDGITGPVVRNILFGLKGEMREKYLLPTLRGEKRACFAQTA